MALPSLSWGRYISVVLLYWLLVVGGWRFYTTRPSTQRRAREQHLIAERKDPVTGTSALHRVVGASQAMRCAGCCLTSA